MVQGRYRGLNIATLIILNLFFMERLFADSFIERMVMQATDAAGDHLFLVNPATALPGALKGEVLIDKGTYNNRFKQTSNNGQVEQQQTESTNDYLAVAMMTNVGAGLGLGIDHQRNFHETTSKEQDGDRDHIETRSSQISTARAVVELTETLKAGILIRFMEVEYNLIGSFNVGTNTTTNYKGSLFGSGGGLHLNLNNFCAGAAYIPPLKGKTEVFAEEKILTQPGIAEIAVAFGPEKWIGGFSYRRWIHKEDDRHAGTTLNDNNQSEVSLFGLDVEQTTIFPLNQLQIGMIYKISQKTRLNFSLSRDTVEFNFDPVVNLPGDNTEEKETYTYNKAIAVIVLNNDRFDVQFGVHYQPKDHEFTNDNGAKVSFSGSRRDFFAGVGGSL